MNKPKPIAEVIVTPIFAGSTHLSITASSADAEMWIRENAEEFGELLVPNAAVHRRNFSLRVDDNYRVHEVAEYIRTMGGAAKDVPSAFADPTESS